MSEEKPCDPEDLMCQFRILGHLQALQNEVGTESFKSKFPALTGLGKSVAENITSQRETLRGSLESCGILIPDELKEIEPTAELGEMIDEPDIE